MTDPITPTKEQMAREATDEGFWADVDSLAAALQDSIGIPRTDHTLQDFGDIAGGALMRPHEAAAAIIQAAKEAERD